MLYNLHNKHENQKDVRRLVVNKVLLMKLLDLSTFVTTRFKNFSLLEITIAKSLIDFEECTPKFRTLNDAAEKSLN